MERNYLLIPGDTVSVKRLFRVAGIRMPKNWAINYLCRIGLKYCAIYMGWTGRYKGKRENFIQWRKRSKRPNP